MAVPTRIYDISATAASNSPGGTESIGTSLDDYIRGIQATIRSDLASKGADIASAATTDLAAVTGLAHDITGVTSITSFGTVAAGVHKIVKFEGALTLTHNATSLILPGGANITTADVDIGWFISEGSGNWRCISYFKAAIRPFADASDTVKGVIETATAAEMETGTSAVVAVTPSVQHNHPGHPKAFGNITGGGTPVLGTAYNITSIADTAVGRITVTIGTDFSTDSYAVLTTLQQANTAEFLLATVTAKAAGSFEINTYASGSVLTDMTTGVSFACFGDQ